MNRFRSTVLALTAAVAGVTLGGAQPVTATVDPGVGTQVLDLLCRSKDGQPFVTPFTISRCQEARTPKGVEVEQLICEGLLGGTFQRVDSPGRPNRTNWACVHGPVAG
jgi:hypothetical protein